MDEQDYREWTPVTERMELAEAEAVAAYLRANGIPARVVPEVGSRGLWPGRAPANGARVTAPAWLESEATFAAANAGLDDDGADKDAGVMRRRGQEPERDFFSRLSRVMMLVAAVAFSPFAVLFALIYVVVKRFRRASG